MKKRLLNSIIPSTASVSQEHEDKVADYITLMIMALATLICGANMLINYYIDYTASVYVGAFMVINLSISMVLYFKLKMYTLGGYLSVLTSVIGTALALYLEGQLSFNFSYFFAIVFSLPFLIKRNENFVFNATVLSITLAIVAISTLLISPKLPLYYAVTDAIINLKLRFNASISLFSILLFATLLTYAISKYIFTLINDKHTAETEKDKRLIALYSLGHELRTQINSINGITQLVTELNNTTTNNTKQLKQYAKILDGCNDQMLQLVNDVLDVHKIESGKLELLYQTRNLGSLITLLSDKHKPLAAAKHLNFIDRYDPQTFADMYVRIDSSRFSQILENLLSNAIKYTENGSIEFHATMVEETLKTVTITFAVKDTGVGIAQDHYQTIFESFRKIKNVDSGMYGGSGLGLSLTKAILEKMNSEIQLTSTLGKGTTFSFNLTLDKVDTHSTVQQEPSKETTSKQKTILIAEDNPISMLYTNTVLQNYGMLTHKATNGIEAIEVVKSNSQLDTILLDLEMPKLNGYEAIKEIKRLRPELSVIAFTATKPEKEFIENLYDLGFNDYLTKPFKKEELLDIIERPLVKK